MRVTNPRWPLLLVLVAVCQMIGCDKKSPSEPSESSPIELEGVWSGITSIERAHGSHESRVPQDGTYCWDRFLNQFPQSSSFSVKFSRQSTTARHPGSFGGTLVHSHLGVYLVEGGEVVCETVNDSQTSNVYFQKGKLFANFYCRDKNPRSRFWYFSCVRNSSPFPRWQVTQQPRPNRDIHLAEEVHAYGVQLEGRVIGNQIHGTWGAHYIRYCGAGNENWNSECSLNALVFGPGYIGDLGTGGTFTLTKQ
jgi:hypothetical protein